MYRLTFKKAICIVLYALTAIPLTAQTFTEIVTKVNDFYIESSGYNIESTFKMYRGYTGNTLSESYKGIMYKKKGITGVTVLGSDVILFPSAQITISEKTKTIIYSKIEEKQRRLIESDKIAKFYNQTDLKEDDKKLVYEMTLKSKSAIIPYNKMVFHINKEDFSIIKQEFYFSGKVPFTNENGQTETDFARMEISYLYNDKPIKKNHKIKDYLVINSDNQVSLSKAYNSYKLIDQTPYN